MFHYELVLWSLSAVLCQYICCDLLPVFNYKKKQEKLSLPMSTHGALFRGELWQIFVSYFKFEEMWSETSGRIWQLYSCNSSKMLTVFSDLRRGDIAFQLIAKVKNYYPNICHNMPLCFYLTSTRDIHCKLV